MIEKKSEDQGGDHAGKNYGTAASALRNDCTGSVRGIGNVGSTSYLQKSYAKNKSIDEPEGEMAESLENKGQASEQDESSGMGTVTSFTALSWNGFFLVTRLDMKEGLPLQYIYMGTAVPVSLLLLRQALDFSYREDLVINSLADYILQVRSKREELPSARKAAPISAPEKPDPVLQEEMVERITASIRQTAATGSHFSKMLSPEEEEIMREIIREFMD